MRKFVIPLDVKEDLFCEEELVTVLEGLKNNKAPGADSVINEFLKYGGSEIRNTENYEYDFWKRGST